jgi:hypothetical protein
MSSTSLTTIQTQLNLYGYSLFMVLGNVGNAFIVILFSQQRQNACSIYLLSSVIVNTLYLIYVGFVTIFAVNYGDQTPLAFGLCKINPYITSVLGQVAKTMLVFACIDRFLITSDRATFRAFSTPKRAKYLIFFSVLFWSLLPIHVPIMETLINGQCSVSGVYSTIYSIYLIIFVGLIPPITSGIFGYLTYRNMRQIHNRVQPIAQNPNDANVTIRRRDRDLLVLVISETLVYIVTSCPFPFVFLEMMISPYTVPNKSFQYFQIEILAVNVALLLLFINSAAAFYTYVIASKQFRRDFKQLITKAYRKLRRQTPVQIIARADQSLTRRETHV